MNSCFACVHSIATDIQTGEKLIREGTFTRGPALYPISYRPICLKRGVAYCQACPQFEPVSAKEAA